MKNEIYKGKGVNPQNRGTVPSRQSNTIELSFALRRLCESARQLGMSEEAIQVAFSAALSSSALCNPAIDCESFRQKEAVEMEPLIKDSLNTTATIADLKSKHQLNRAKSPPTNVDPVCKLVSLLSEQERLRLCAKIRGLSVSELKANLDAQYATGVRPGTLYWSGINKTIAAYVRRSGADFFEK